MRPDGAAEGHHGGADPAVGPDPGLRPALLIANRQRDSPAELTHCNLLHTTPDRQDWSVWLAAFRVKGIDVGSGDVYPSGDSDFRAQAFRTWRGESFSRPIP